jgi:hypothetical protein
MSKSAKSSAAPSPSHRRPADPLALAKSDGVPDQKRSHHGFRGVPPPPVFDFDALPDGALLSEYETAAVGRWSTNTLAAWRLRQGHSAGGFIRYRVSAIRAFLADAAPRNRKPAKREPRSRATADPVPATQEPAR